MKILLTGHEASKMILPTSSWLWKKYGADGFDIKFLNFGSYDGELFKGEFVSMAKEQVGGKGAWAEYVIKYVKSIKDKYVVLGCDDFLLNDKTDIKRYKELKKLLGGNVKCARLCDMQWYSPAQYNVNDRGIMDLKRDADYTCTGQLTIWERKVLVEQLRKSGDVWNFESGGSKRMEENDWRVVGSYEPPFKYHTISALSGGDKKIDLGGINEKDREYIINNLITEGNVK